MYHYNFIPAATNTHSGTRKLDGSTTAPTLARGRPLPWASLHLSRPFRLSTEGSRKFPAKGAPKSHDF